MSESRRARCCAVVARGGACLIGGLLLTGCPDHERAIPAAAQPAETAGDSEPGNVIFVHPDGMGASHWAAGRALWVGPDADLAWDRLPELAVYRGHMSDRLTGTSNGGATSHAFGVKVRGPGSYGRDGQGLDARPIRALSGFDGSIMREAAHAGHPTGVVNDGDLAEPGTGAFLAEANDRTQTDEIAVQILLGRPGHDDPPPWVVLGGGEAFLLPEGSPGCAEEITVDCAVHVDPVTGEGPARGDGRNLIKEASAAGWHVVRTRSEFEALRQALEERPDYIPRVLGAFARDDLFNDASEEVLIERGLTDPGRERDDPRGRLIVWGSAPGTRGFDPPSAAEMSDLALTILARQSVRGGKPFLLVVEVESADNLANVNNAIGTLRAIRRADEVIERACRFQDQVSRTLVLTVADSDAGGLELLAPPALQADGRVTVTDVNPTGRVADGAQIPIDGTEGRATAPFLAAADARGRRFPFAVAWSGQPDFAGGILARAQGAHAAALSGRFGGSLDNTDVYRLMYRTLFGRWPDGEEGLTQP